MSSQVFKSGKIHCITSAEQIVQGFPVFFLLEISSPSLLFIGKSCRRCTCGSAAGVPEAGRVGPVRSGRVVSKYVHSGNVMSTRFLRSAIRASVWRYSVPISDHHCREFVR